MDYKWNFCNYCGKFYAVDMVVDKGTYKVNFCSISCKNKFLEHYHGK